MKSPLERLKYHVTGAIERGEGVAITEQPAKLWQVRPTNNSNKWDVCTHDGTLIAWNIPLRMAQQICAMHNATV